MKYVLHGIVTALAFAGIIVGLLVVTTLQFYVQHPWTLRITITLLIVWVLMKVFYLWLLDMNEAAYRRDHPYVEIRGKLYERIDN